MNKNTAFQIAFCETNLRWIAGEQPSEARDRRQLTMCREIERLNKSELSELEHNGN